MNYRDYIQSEAWQRVRKRRVTLARGCCEFCGAHRKVDVHHLTYFSVGRESDDDLIVLCRSCHDDVHQFPKLLADVKRLAVTQAEGRRTRESEQRRAYEGSYAEV